MKFEDQRFAQDPRFRYFASNTCLRHTALRGGNLFVQKNTEVANMDPEELRSALIENPNLYRYVLAFGANLRSTPAYWHRRTLELKSMVEQLGSATLFITFSAADLHWPELYRLMDTDGDIPFVNEYAKNRRQALLNKNPHIASLYFEERFTAFCEEILFKVFDVKDYWFRSEFQHRGSIHKHGFIWLEGAPNIENLDVLSDEEIANVITYFDNLTSACNTIVFENIGYNISFNPCKINFNDVPDNLNYEGIENLAAKHLFDYQILLRKIQRHTKCSRSTCLRKNRQTNQWICRYKF